MRVAFTFLLVLAFARQCAAGQPLETETARVLPPGTFELELGGERQGSVDGSEFAVPLALEWGVARWLELLIEPVPYTRIHLGPRWELALEVLGNSAARSDSTENASVVSTVSPEIGGSELVGTIGGRWRASRGILFTLGVSLDSNLAVLVHPGATFRW